MKNSFKQEDKEKVTEFLNFIAVHAKFNVSTKELIKFFHLLSYMQKDLLPKIEDHYFEVLKVHENDSAD